jgi:hypothetical protein
VFNFLFAAYIVLGPVVSQRSYGGAAAWATVATVASLAVFTVGLAVAGPAAALGVHTVLWELA